MVNTVTRAHFAHDTVVGIFRLVLQTERKDSNGEENHEDVVDPEKNLNEEKKSQSKRFKSAYIKQVDVEPSINYKTSVCPFY